MRRDLFSLPDMPAALFSGGASTLAPSGIAPTLLSTKAMQTILTTKSIDLVCVLLGFSDLALYGLGQRMRRAVRCVQDARAILHAGGAASIGKATWKFYDWKFIHENIGYTLPVFQQPSCTQEVLDNIAAANLTFLAPKGTEVLVFFVEALPGYQGIDMYGPNAPIFVAIGGGCQLTIVAPVPGEDILGDTLAHELGHRAGLDHAECDNQFKPLCGDPPSATYHCLATTKPCYTTNLMTGVNPGTQLEPYQAAAFTNIANIAPCY